MRPPYQHIWAPEHPEAHADGRVPVHRMVAHDTYGPIPPEHDVHHRNHDTLDNRPENLEVLPRGKHRRAHLKVPDADIYAEYLKGLSTVEIAERVGHDPANVWRQIVRIRDAAR